jgi:hypothetical protein
VCFLRLVLACLKTNSNDFLFERGVNFCSSEHRFAVFGKPWLYHIWAVFALKNPAGVPALD